MNLSTISFKVSPYSVYRTFQSCYSTNKKPPLLSHDQFKLLGIEALKFLQVNGQHLRCQDNESGFVRINIPLKNDFKVLGAIEKLRINFWSPSTNVQIVPESIHTHPGYFESWIVQGGYTHERFELSNQKVINSKVFECYRVYKDGGSKSFAYIGPVALQNQGTETVKENQIIGISPDLTHRVLKTALRTLSINAVWGQGKGSYDVFLSEKGTPDDIKVERTALSIHQSRDAVEEMIEILSGKLNVSEKK
jgi:hypothetical protein